MGAVSRLASVTATLALLGLAPIYSRQPVTPEAAARFQVPRLEHLCWSPDSQRLAYIREGELYVFELARPTPTRLVSLRELEQAAMEVPAEDAHRWVNRQVREQKVQWFPDSQSLLVEAGGDLFRVDARSGQWRALTRTASAERDPKLSPDGRWLAYRVAHDLYVQELRTGRVRRLTHDGSETLLNGELDWVYPEELDLGTAYWWSPDSRWLAFLQFDVSSELLYPHVDLLDTEPVYEPQRYPKAGTPNARVRLGVISVRGGKIRWLPVGDTSNALIARVAWLPTSDALAVQKLNRVQDRLEVIRFSADGGPGRVLLTETDPYWINVSDDWRFLPASGSLLWSSERDGYRHLYLYDLEGKLKRQLTQGEWQVTSVACVDEASGHVYFTSTDPSPLERQLWVVSLGGGTPRRITPEPGTHNVTMSPDCRYFVDTHSSLERPPVTVVRQGTGSVVAVLDDRAQRLAADYELLPVEIHKVPGPEGQWFYGALILPPGFDRARRYPAVVLVYGGPHGQLVRDSWTGPNLAQALAYRGFVVWQMDNRGTWGRGHGWEVGVYRRLGKVELEDQLAGLNYLITKGFVDPNRVGIHGWSYGGFLTLYALLHAPEHFQAGVAGAPVTDWRNYDTIYTERYLGLPQNNEQGYHDSSPVNFASRLRAPLLLVHNFEDDNVLFQNTLQMAVALQRAGKPFEIMIYPQKAHGISSEFRQHFYDLLVRFFERTLKTQNR